MSACLLLSERIGVLEAMVTLRLGYQIVCSQPTSVFPRSSTGSRRPKHEGPGHNPAPEYVQAEGAQVSIGQCRLLPFPPCP